jgi:ribosomal protein S18 acetylase RimI-like enzyme
MDRSHTTGKTTVTEVTLRPARLGDSARCQEIAVAAWESIHAERRRLLGDVLYDHLTDDWRSAKAAAVARHLEQYPNWTIVACISPAPEQSELPDIADSHEASETSGIRNAPAVWAEHADDMEQVVAFVTFRLDHERSLGTIGNNAVDPAWQGRGIARALYRHVLDQFRAEGMRFATVTTGLDAGHAPALAAYRKAGFTVEVPSVTLYQEL